jgi:hypothetical protein
LRTDFRRGSLSCRWQSHRSIALQQPRSTPSRNRCRIQLKNAWIAVFELTPPITATPPFEDGNIEDIGVQPMPSQRLVAAIVAGINQDRLEIRPGLSNTSNS